MGVRMMRLVWLIGLLAMVSLMGACGGSDENEDSQSCVDGASQNGVTPCGENGDGFFVQICSDGAWVDSTECEGGSGTPTDSDPSEPDPTDTEPAGDYRIGSTPCGPEADGLYVQALNVDTWSDTTLCMMSGDREYDEMHFGAGYAPAEWDYDQAEFPARGMYGWSYYARAFDLIRDTPVHELGWGQWSKPSAPADGLSVCGIHPHGFMCDEEPPTAEEMAGEVANCGHQDYQSLENCRVWCCGEEDKCGVRGSIEGGMGYWMYTLETPQVKWMLPGSTNANYEIFGGTFLNDRQQGCTTLGGAVRVANNLLIPNDFVSFEDDTVNGFLGYMLSRTPIGKRSATDNANYWTIVIDTENFSGPVMYMSSWFWDSRINWHPESVSWSDPRALLGYIAQGFEGRLGGIQVVDANGVKWRRTNRWAFPKDVTGGVPSDSTTLFTGHSQYNSDWAVEAMEPMLSGTGAPAQRTPAAVKAKALSDRQAPGGGCNLPEEDGGVGLESEEDGLEINWDGFGVSTGANTAANQAATNAANCHVKLELDPSKMDCSSMPGWCEGHRYIKVNADGSSPEVVASGSVPGDVRSALDLRQFKETRKNDGRFLGPPDASEASCFENPGPAPADPRLYCTRTKSGNWIGFKWYRFVDQPEMNQVFASLPTGERDAAKCFMQARIERLHEAQQEDGEIPRWFDVPQGADALPGEKVAIDTALLVTPPVGLEKGFVPISVYERKRTKPEGCEVTLGDIQEEPNPLPANYYEGFAADNGGYDIEWCPANPESGGVFSYPGTIYQYSPDANQNVRVPYVVPTRDQVASGLSATPVVCGLASDAP